MLRVVLKTMSENAEAEPEETDTEEEPEEEEPEEEEVEEEEDEEESEPEFPRKTVIYGLTRTALTDEDVERIAGAVNEAGYDVEEAGSDGEKVKFIRRENFGEDEDESENE